MPMAPHNERLVHSPATLRPATRIRRKLRYTADALFCRSFKDKECIGRESQWTLRTGGLNQGSVVYSGGVGEDISFETTLVRRFGLSITLFDPSPPALGTVSRADMTNIEFVPQGLSG